MRFPLGVLSQYIGRKNAAIVEMSCHRPGHDLWILHGEEAIHDVLAMGVLARVSREQALASRSRSGAG